MKQLSARIRVTIWQGLFICLGTSWLLAPSLNHYLSDRTTLISQYESAGQPYSLLFRLCDLLAGILLVWAALHYYRHKSKGFPAVLLLTIGIGMILDPIFTINCHLDGLICHEGFSLSSLIHAIESTATGLALFVLSTYDAKTRQRLASIAFVVFQFGYGLLLLSKYADRQHFNTASQYIYQCITIVWLAWYVRDSLYNKTRARYRQRLVTFVRHGTSIWVLLSGLASIALGLFGASIQAVSQRLYFSRTSAGLAQLGVVVGSILLYSSYHLLRGKRQAWRIALTMLGVEVLTHAVIVPNWKITLFYSLSFCLLFVSTDYFERDIPPST